AKDLLQPACLPNVGSHGTKSLGVDMVNVFGADPGFRQGAANGSRQPGARTSTIERRAETSQLRINSSAAPARVLQIFNHQDSGSLTRNDAVPLAIKRSTSLFRSVVAPGKRCEQAVP